MHGDIPIGVLSQLDISSRPHEQQSLRDDGRELFSESSDYDLRTANEEEIESSGLMHHPMLHFVRLARIEGGKAVALVFRIETYHCAAINDASDDWLESAWDALEKLGFEPFAAEPKQEQNA